LCPTWVFVLLFYYVLFLSFSNLIFWGGFLCLKFWIFPLSVKISFSTFCDKHWCIYISILVLFQVFFCGQYTQVFFFTFQFCDIENNLPKKISKKIEKFAEFMPNNGVNKLNSNSHPQHRNETLPNFYNKKIHPSKRVKERTKKEGPSS
jgi:hypothetical protein